ncbi:MAG: NAD(P)/FAD-dependent oxidoreductase [Candidatus Dormibacter sp.]
MPEQRHPLTGQKPVQGDPTEEWEAEVVIIGGAVGGMGMAIALSTLGVSSVVLERHRQIQEINRGDALQPMGLSILERWGVLDRIVELGAYNLKEWTFWNPRLGYLGTWSFENLDFPFKYAKVLRHPKIHQAFSDVVVQRKEIQMHRGATVTTVLMNDDRITGVMGTLDDGAVFRARGRVVVGADGQTSHFREFLGIAAEQRYVYDHEYLMVFVDKPQIPELDSRGMRWITRNGLTVLIPLDGGTTLRVAVQIEKGSLPKWRKLTNTELLYQLKLRAPVLEKVSATLPGAHSYSVHWLHADQYVAHGAALVGDAAHLVHPGTAQGMNMAFCDADILAAVIRNGLRRRNLSDGVLRQYETIRKPVNLGTMEKSHAQTLHHTQTGLWHEIWGSRTYRWTLTPEHMLEMSKAVAGLYNPTAESTGLLKEVATV